MSDVLLGNGYSVEAEAPVTDIAVEMPAVSDATVTVVPFRGNPGPPGTPGPVGPAGPEPDLLDLTTLFENGLH